VSRAEAKLRIYFVDKALRRHREIVRAELQTEADSGFVGNSEALSDDLSWTRILSAKLLIVCAKKSLPGNVVNEISLIF